MTAQRGTELRRDEVERRLADAARHFEISHDMICTLTFGGRIDRVNPAFSKVLGWEADELGPAALIELIHEEEREALLEVMRGMLTTGEGEGTNRFRTKDGGWRWVEWAAVLDADSRRAFAAGRDISERRRLEQESAERQQRLLTLTNTAPVGIYELDADGDCTFVNEYYCALLGIEPEAALGKGWLDLVHPRDLESMAGDWLAAAAAGKEFNREYRYRRRDGGVVWVVGRAVTLTGPDGERSGALGTIVDITPRIEAERALERERGLLAEAQRTASVGSWRWDLETRLVEWSEQNFRNHGFEPVADAPSAEDFIAAVHADDRDAVTGLMRSVAAEPRDFLTSYRVVHPEGGVHELELRGAVVPGGAAIAGTSRDVTAEREAERLKDDFFNLISHELRTPLTSIIGYTELLAEVEGEGLSEEGRKFLEVIERNSRRELSLVGDLLMLTRIEAGSFRVERGEADLERIVAEAVEEAMPGAERSEVELVFSSTETPTIEGDAHRLGQVVTNLISNAVKFTPAGGVVRITLAPAGAAGVRLEVADTGIGIPESEQRLLFDRMYRAREAERRQIQGTGLGLTIVKAIVDAHRGWIEVSSTEGEGATFTIELPARASDAAEPGPAVAVAEQVE